MEKNNRGQTPLHIAAECGSLYQIPGEFLTGDTLRTRTGPPHAPDGVYATGSGYMAKTETVLHIAVRCGHADQIPKEFLTPEFLRLEASGYRLTLLHDLAYANRLDLVPDAYANSEIWNLRDYIGRTPRDLIQEKVERQAYVDDVRSEPATEKQKEKLRWFGCTWDEGITKGQASDALDTCARQFPDRDAEYYSRPATEEQKAKLRAFRKNPDDNRWDGPLTYGEAKDLIREIELEKQREELDYVCSEEGQIAEMTEIINHCGVSPRPVTNAEITEAWQLAVSRQADKSFIPSDYSIVDSLSELFPDLMPLKERY